MAGTVYENDGVTQSTTKRLNVVLTPDGTDIEDLIIEDVPACSYMRDSTGRRLDSVAIPSFDEMLAPPHDGWFLKARHGVFCHYAWGGSGQNETVFRNGTVPSSLDQLATAFDATQFAADVAAMGAEFVVFTIYHFAMYARCTRQR